MPGVPGNDRQYLIRRPPGRKIIGRSPDSTGMPEANGWSPPEGVLDALRQGAPAPPGPLCYSVLLSGCLSIILVRYRTLRTRLTGEPRPTRF